MRQLSLLLLLSAAMFCSTAMAESCRHHEDCIGSYLWRKSACSQRKCTDLCFSSYSYCNQGVNNARDRDGKTPLHKAAIENSVDLAQLLLANSANLNAAAVSGRFRGLTPLQVAEYEGNQEVAELLRNAAKDCFYHKDCGKTQACSQENTWSSRKCMNFCVSDKCNKGVNNARDGDFSTPLHRAVFVNRVDVAKLLLENSANVESTANTFTALHDAAHWNRVEVAKVLIENSANVNRANTLGTTPLHQAAKKNSVAVAKLLIQNSAKVDSRDNNGETPLHYAASENSVGVAKLLLEKSANLNARVVSGYYKSLTPLQIAESRGNQEMVQLLRNAAKDCERHWDCGITQACSQRKCVNLCFYDKCNKGVNNARDSVGWTPLHEAASENRVDVAKQLLEKSASVDSTDNQSLTALHYAAYYNNVEMAKLLIKYSANLNAKITHNYSYKGMTPLQVAEFFGNQEMVELLRNA